MDLFSSLTSFLQGLAFSTLVILQMMSVSASSLLTSLSSSWGSLASEHIEVPVPAQTAATSSQIVTTEATSTPKTQTAKTTTTAPKAIAKKPVVVTSRSSAKTAATSAPQTPLLSSDQVNQLARASIVNILCTENENGQVLSISGSGVIIDARGVILTNAHIGQYFLLKDYPSPDSVDCEVRAGSPATPTYRAQLIYLPQAWIDANASQITAEHGTGTGENDYAFLRITSAFNPANTLPATFPNIGMTTYTDTGDSVLVAGYPAGFLDAETIERNLYATSAFTTVGQLYTFDDPSHVDVISLGGTVVSQGGSSGGAVVRAYDGKLSGLIATATMGTTTASRDLRAITINYINQSLTNAGQGGLVGLLSQNLDTIASNFAPTFAKEKQELINALSH